MQMKSNIVRKYGKTADSYRIGAHVVSYLRASGKRLSICFFNKICDGINESFKAVDDIGKRIAFSDASDTLDYGEEFGNAAFHNLNRIRMGINRIDR